MDAEQDSRYADYHRFEGFPERQLVRAARGVVDQVAGGEQALPAVLLDPRLARCVQGPFTRSGSVELIRRLVRRTEQGSQLIFVTTTSPAAALRKEAEKAFSRRGRILSGAKALEAARSNESTSARMSDVAVICC